MKKRGKYDIRHKETLTLFLREYFELFFPDLVEKIRFRTARFLDKELIELFGKSQGRGNGKNEEHKITDALILVSVLMNNKWEWVLIHWEQQGQKTKGFEERMFHYFCGIYFRYRKLVFPIAMFTDPAKWRKPVKETFNLSLFQYPINEFTYRLIKLKNFKAEEFETRIEENPLAAAYLPLTDYPKKERLLIKAKAVKGVAKIPDGRKQATLLSLINESIMLNGEEEKQFQELIKSNQAYREVEMLQSVEELGMEKGIEIGIERGKELGMEKGQALASMEIAKNMIRSGKWTNEEIASVTGLNVGKLDELSKTLRSK